MTCDMGIEKNSDMGHKHCSNSTGRHYVYLIRQDDIGIS